MAGTRTMAGAEGVRWSDRSISKRLHARDNSLNLVRLALAMMVLLAHSYVLSGNGLGPLFNGDTLGTWAVHGFFCLSGFLITGSRLRSKFTDYLTHRLARIFPAFLVSLVVVAFVFAPFTYARQHGTLDGFLTTAPTPLQYLAVNFALSIREYNVAGTIADNPYPSAWNGSLWTLYYEFLCYLVIGAVLCVALLRRRPILLLPLWLASVFAAVHSAETLAFFDGNAEIAALLKLLPWFLGGACVYVLREMVPLTWSAAVPAFAAFVGLVSFDGVWGPPLSAPLLTLFLLWLGKVLPSPTLLRHHDISYGCYVYAFPSQQLVAALGGAAAGTYVHAALSVPSTVALAIASWLVVERPAMRAVRGHRPPLNEGDLAQGASEPDPVARTPDL